MANQASPIVDLQPQEYEHDLDRKALNTLHAIPGIEFLLQQFIKQINERALRLSYTGSNIKVTRRSFSSLYDLFEGVCYTLDLDFKPELYIDWDYSVNACTVGIGRPMVVVSSGSVDLLSQEELAFVLGHEIGHIKSGHVLYRQIAQLLPFLRDLIGEAPRGFGRLFAEGIEVALYYWERMSELTADRAGILACQDREATLRAMIKWAGMPQSHYPQIDVESFVEQARGFEGFDASSLNWIAKFMLTLRRTHPWTVMRASELLKWIDSGAYDNILRRSSHPETEQSALASRTIHLASSHTHQTAVLATASAHADLLDAIRNILSTHHFSDIYVTPEIPLDKLHNAHAAYAGAADSTKILCLYDSTLFGGAKDGICLTSDSLYYKNLDAPICKPLAHVKSIEKKASQGFLDPEGIMIDGQFFSIVADHIDVIIEIITAARDFFGRKECTRS